ncbi:argonaute-like protein [Mycena amicta]|nr:argonaute-like protein [Mycena amicta]
MPPRHQGGGRRPPGPQAQAQAAAPAFQPPPEHVTTVGVLRPGYGRNGKAFKINVNSFTTDIPDGFIFHYDGVISSEKALPSRLNMDIINALQTSQPKIFAENPASFDGRKNMYTAAELQMDGDGREFDVSLSDTPDAPATPQRPPKIYKVRITLVAKINSEILHRFVNGKQSQDNTVSTALQALNVVGRMHPSSTLPAKGRSFYVLENSLDLWNGLLAVRGYFQSIRPGQGKMLVNVDISTGVVYKDGPLLNLCLAYLGETKPDVLSSKLDERRRLRLSRFITGVRVQTQDAGNQNVVRSRVIRRLHNQGANTVTFTIREGGTKKTVAQYFADTRNKPLQFPSLLCIEVGQGALIPLELCKVLPGQLVRKEIPEDKKKDLVRFASMPPNARLQDIKKGLEILAYGQSEYVHKFGMTVSPKLVETTARLLEAPRLKYGQGSKVPDVQPKNGVWNMADKKFFRPATIANWALVILDPYFRDNNINDVTTNFVAGCRSTGMTVVDPVPVAQRLNAQGNVPELLTGVGKQLFQLKKAAPALFVIILPDGGNDIYTTVKHWGDILKGVATQCLKSRNCLKANIQFWANVALKVNGKMGGINVIIDPTQGAILSDPRNPTVVLGADVMHPGAGTNGRPSYAAVVGSKDSHAASYTAIHGVQASRQELITELRLMTKYVVGKYMNYRQTVEKVPAANAPPKRLIFFRDGVSEGQFQQVLDNELPLIKGACADLGINPLITLVVVGKRHHNRLFPQENSKDADKSGNCPAGTVVDRDIGHPTLFDYYLQSHGGLLGTSRPGHYSVLHDDNKLSADAMQALSFALCHVYAGSTRSVSIPAPVYYADKVCARAKIHFDPSKREGDLSETASTTDTSTSDTLEAFRRDFMPLNGAQSDRMYFA